MEKYDTLALLLSFFTTVTAFKGGGGERSLAIMSVEKTSFLSEVNQYETVEGEAQ